MIPRERASRLRQRLREAEEKLCSLLEGFTAERGPLVRGLFQAHGTRCGKPNCKCLKGDLHQTAVLVVSEEGKRRNIYVRIPDRPNLQRRSERYRRFRKRRAELARLAAETLGLVDELLEALVTPYSPPKTGQTQERTRTRPGRTR
jgi:hypothetical protein